MKKLSILLLAFIAVIGFNACSSEDDVVFVAQPDPEGINFTSSFSSTYTLTEATLENTAERFVWNTIEVDVPTNITYELQGSTSADFSSFAILGATSENNLAITVQQLMDLAEDAGLDNDPETEDMPNTGQLYFRVVASVGNEGGMAHTSEVQALTVVLPEATGEEEETFMNFFLVGDATAAGWNTNNNNTPLFRDPANENIFYFTGRFAGGEGVEGFKLLEILGVETWPSQWGLNNGTFTSRALLGADPTAFPVESDAFYSLMVNADEMTYTWEEYDASGAATYETLGILGPATPSGWDADTDLIQSEFNPHIWYANDFELADGEFKFRANDAWDANWGVASPALSGQAALGSQDNMTATAGVYDIWFNDLTGRYILIPQVVE